MLRIIIEPSEWFNERTQEFEEVPGATLELEHSLMSLSKWESKHQKPFLSAGKKTAEEVMDYLKAMILTPDVDPDVLHRCSQKTIDEIQAYIDSSQTATTFGRMPERRGPTEVITSELIYYWMISCNIPVEFQYWHLNRLFALIRVFNVKNSPKKKMTSAEMLQERARLNEERKQKFNTTG